MKREFSWSYQRYKIYEYCKRAYYYSYYKSWKGWKSTASEEVKKIYTLKKARSYIEILHDILIESILELKQTNTFEIKHLKGIFLRKVNLLLNEIKFHTHTHKSIYIREIIFKQITSNQIYQAASNFIQMFSNISSNKIWEKLQDMDTFYIIPIENPVLFFNNCVKIWTHLDFAFHAKNRIKIININLTGNMFSESWSIQAGLNKLFILQKYAPDNYTHIDTETFFIHKHTISSVNTHRNLKEIQDIIDASIFKMLQRTELESNIEISQFPKNDNIEKCNNCVFREICFKTS